MKTGKKLDKGDSIERGTYTWNKRLRTFHYPNLQNLNCITSRNIERSAHEKTILIILIWTVFSKMTKQCKNVENIVFSLMRSVKIWRKPGRFEKWKKFIKTAKKLKLFSAQHFYLSFYAKLWKCVIYSLLIPIYYIDYCLENDCTYKVKLN